MKQHHRQTGSFRSANGVLPGTNGVLSVPVSALQASGLRPSKEGGPSTPEELRARLQKENKDLQRKLHVLTLEYARVSSELQALRRSLPVNVAVRTNASTPVQSPVPASKTPAPKEFRVAPPTPRDYRVQP